MYSISSKYDLLTRMSFMLHCKCMIIIIFLVLFAYSLSLFIALWQKCAMWSSCRNRRTSWCLCIKMDCPFCFYATSLRHHHLGIHFFLLDISCIKCTITYSIVIYFIGIDVKMMIKYSDDGDKLSRKVQTISSFFNISSKQRNQFANALILLMWSTK